jgi:hypothetical protein
MCTEPAGDGWMSYGHGSSNGYEVSGMDQATSSFQGIPPNIGAVLLCNENNKGLELALSSNDPLQVKSQCEMKPLRLHILYSLHQMTKFIPRHRNPFLSMIQVGEMNNAKLRSDQFQGTKSVDRNLLLKLTL